MFACSQHWIVTVQRLFDAFVYTNNGQAPSTYYLTIEAATHVAATAFVVASVIVGDIILVRTSPSLSCTTSYTCPTDHLPRHRFTVSGSYGTGSST